MVEFVVNKKNLKAALKLSLLATAKGAEILWSHTLFKSKNGQIYLYSTDKDLISMATITPVLSNAEADFAFTASPKKLLDLIESSEVDDLRFAYDDDSKTLQIYATENKDCHLSLPSFEAKDFLLFDDEMEKAHEIKAVNAGVFKFGLQYVEKFALEDKKASEYTKIHLYKSTLFAANNSNMIGAFKSQEFDGIDSLIIRKNLIGPIVSFIDETDPKSVSIKTTSKFVIFTPDNSGAAFGFLKSVEPNINFPISTDVQELNGFTINREQFVKKISRMGIADKEAGIKIRVVEDSMSMETVSDRPSTELMSCSRVKSREELNFIIDPRLFIPVLKQFQKPEISICLDNLSCWIRDDGDLVIEEGEEKSEKSYIMVARLCLSTVA